MAENGTGNIREKKEKEKKKLHGGEAKQLYDHPRATNQVTTFQNLKSKREREKHKPMHTTT